MIDPSTGVWAVDLLIAFTLLEACGLWLWHRAGRGGIDPAGMLPNMAAGLCLMLALRAALAGPHWAWIALSVTGSGVAHAWDLRRRWQLAHRKLHGAGEQPSTRAAPAAVDTASLHSTTPSRPRAAPH